MLWGAGPFWLSYKINVKCNQAAQHEKQQAWPVCKQTGILGESIEEKAEMCVPVCSHVECVHVCEKTVVGRQIYTLKCRCCKSICWGELSMCDWSLFINVYWGVGTS